MSRKPTFVQQNNVASLLNQLSNDLKNIANQPNSIAAFFVARKLNQRIDEIIKNQSDDNAFITALIFLAVEQSNIMFLKLLLQRMERHFGKSALNRFMDGHNEQRQSLLVFAVSHNCSTETIEYLTNTVEIPITEQVIYTALFNSATPALNHFLKQGDTEDLSQNKLLRLSNTVDAYIKEYGTDTACEAYKTQIHARLIQRNLTLTFEKEEVPALPQSSPIPVAVSALDKDINQKRQAANTVEQQEIKAAINQAEDKFAGIKNTLLNVKAQQRDLALSIARIGVTKEYLAAEDIVKEPLSWSQRMRLMCANLNNLFTRSVNWCLDYVGTPTLEKCQHQQTVINKAKQTIVTHQPIAKEIYEKFCKPNKKPLTLASLQIIETDLIQQKQKIISRRKVLNEKHTEIIGQLSKLRQKLQALVKQTIPQTSHQAEEMTNHHSANKVVCKLV